jgi:hypothetical protein
MKVSPTRRGFGVAALLCAFALAGPAVSHAVTTQTFTTSQNEFDPGVKNQGWWAAQFPNFDANDNYIAGGTVAPERNFFSFDLTSACQASGVTLQLTRFEQTGPLTYRLFDVTTPAPTLNANQGASPAIFMDLGSGTSFGSFDVQDGGTTDVLSFPLDREGVAAFNAARGGFFSIGGQVPTAVNDGFIYGFSGPGAAGTQQLVVTCLPSSKDECKDGHWRDFGTIFKNQGDCVSFVATKGKNPPGNSP